MRLSRLISASIVFGALTTAGLHAVAAEIHVQGVGNVVDGQTLEVAGTVLRLRGVLAPPPGLICTTKRDKPYDCGRLALKALSDILNGQTVGCQYDPALDASPDPPQADCRVGAFSVNEQLLLTGRVLADRDAPTAYVRAEMGAKVLREGLWKGRFPPPESWRGR